MQRPYIPTVLVIAVVIAVFVSACTGSSEAQRSAPPDSGVAVTKSDRTSCAAIGTSDLHSPLEGIWYQTHCLAPSAFPQGVATTECNRASLAAIEFRQVAPGSFVYRQTPTSIAYLWYATTPNCLDLVSSRVVTAVCNDHAISFQADRRLSCAKHGGVLVRINGD